MIPALASVVTSALVAVHPYHASTAEADLNPETGRLQVSMEFYPEDLERALSRAHRSDVDLEETEGIGEIIQKYLAERWLFRPVGSDDDFEPEPSDVVFIGMEVFPREAVVYFTIGMPEAEHEDLEMSVITLFETEQVQENAVRLRLDPEGPRRSLVYRFDSLWLPLVEPPTP
ncbi:MAG: DUF6702 family protein [Planctomycetota bacterium]